MMLYAERSGAEYDTQGKNSKSMKSPIPNIGYAYKFKNRSIDICMQYLGPASNYSKIISDINL